MLPLHITRVRSDCSLHFKIRPFSTFRHLLWPLLTSPLPSPAVADALPGNFPGETETSLGKTLIFPPVAAEFTCAMSERLSGLTIPCWLTPSHRPCIRFLSVRAGFCLQLPPHPVSRRRSCLQLTIPVVTARRELSPLRSVPCQAHMGPGHFLTKIPGRRCLCRVRYGKWSSVWPKSRYQRHLATGPGERAGFRTFWSGAQTTGVRLPSTLIAVPVT